MKKNIFSQKANDPDNFFMIYPYLDTSVRRLFKQKYSPADLMHGPINKSDHSDGGSLGRVCIKKCFNKFFSNFLKSYRSRF